MDSGNESYHSESEFYYPDEENVLKENKTFRNTSNSREDEDAEKMEKKINTLFAVLGRSVLGKTVPLVLSTALGLRPRVVLKTSGTVFPNTDRPRTANNIYIRPLF